MEFRLADVGDLEKVKTFYKDIVLSMNKQDIKIWDEVYPCEFLEEDIIKGQVYVLFDKGVVVSAFALSRTNAGQTSVEWEKICSKVFYLEKLGVKKLYSRKGIGSLMLNKAKDISKVLGAEYLRLFVADINGPAISLYEKNAFNKVSGIYEEKFDDGFILNEFGYEIRL